jgi:hypothetical protein
MQIQILIGFFFCHFLADFTHLSTDKMLSAKKLGKPIIPIVEHAGMHGVLMGIFLAFYLPVAQPLFWNILMLQIWSHLIIDVWKGRMNGWFPSLQNPANKFHWILFGFDQFLHACVIVKMSEYAILGL